MPRLALGLQVGHDRSAALIEDGQIVAAIEEERLDRVKHSPGREIPLKAMHHCLVAAGVGLAQIDDVAVTSTRPPEELSGLSCFKADRLAFVGHHLAHAAAGFLTSPWDEAGILVADGSGGKVGGSAREAESIFLGRGNEVSLLWQRTVADTKDLRAARAQEEPQVFSRDLSLGNLYSAASRLIFGDWRYAGKVMALAGLGSVEKPDLEECIHLLDVRRARRPRLGNPAGFAEAVVIAAKIHAVVRRGVLNKVGEALDATGSKALCFGGGVAYNCVINTEIGGLVPNRNLHVFPACGDAGNSIGAALLASAVRVPNPMQMPFHGGAWTEEEILDALTPFVRKNYLEAEVAMTGPLDEERVLDGICDDLLEHGVVGIHFGRSEFGPRALGRRSLLANPALPGIEVLLNRMKGREWFRPFGLMVGEGDSREMFEGCGPSPFMLQVGRLREQYARSSWNVSHADGSTRLQTVSEERAPLLAQLLRRWKVASGVPCLINTSFNGPGEPIVESPVDALRSARRLGLGVVYVGGIRVALSG